jgi:predicted Zn-dependent peptidase
VSGSHIVGRVADITTSTVASNGLPVHTVGLPGTRALTVLVAFDAGARTERVEENGMAHFLEHLVFKGGEKYATYRDVNETAERLGGMLNAYTSHDLVAFHITVRAESAEPAIDLLSDFVARPRLDAEELDRERGVVIQEINRAYDQPSTVAEYLIDRAAFGDHPLGRTVLGPEENLRGFSRDAIVAFRERRWAGAHGGAFLVGNIEHVPEQDKLAELFARFPSLPRPEPYVPAPKFAPETLVEQRDTNQSHLRMIYRPEVSVGSVRERAALSIYSTLLGGSMGSRLFEEIREKRGLCYSVYAVAHAYADVPILQLGSGLDSSKCIEAYTRMREIVDELRDDGPTREEVDRARAYAAGRLVLAFESTNAVARYGASQSIVYKEDIDPDAAIAALDAVTFDEVREVASDVADDLAVACVGPHEQGDF